MNPAERKRQLRRECFRKVQALSASSKKSASGEICQQLSALDEFQRAKTVFSYLPLPSEPDLTPLFGDEKVWGFARVLEDDTMEFHQMTDLTQAVEGSFKIPEPDPGLCPVIQPENADLVIIPGVGFSEETGNRLGRGKGHYARYLSRLLDRSEPPCLVGVCFSVQLCEVEAESHDIPMNRVISA